MSNESDTPTPRTALEQLMSFRHDTFYGREWVLMDDAERLAKQCTQTERELNAANASIAELESELIKLNDPVAVHINMLRGTIATPSRELMEQVWNTATNLDQPTKPTCP